AIVLVVLAGLGGLLYMTERARVAQAADDAGPIEARDENARRADDVREWMRIEPIEVRLGSGLVPVLTGPSGDLSDRIGNLRKQMAMDLGFLLPKVQTAPRGELPPTHYEICFHGNRVGQSELLTDRLMAINPGGSRPRLEGPETRDPAYSLPAQWIAKEARAFARGAGYTIVDPDTVLMTHLSELVKRHASELLTRADTERLLQRVREQHASLVEELVPAIMSYSDVQKVLQILLREQVSIRHLEAILEVLIESGKTVKVHEDLAERVRERLGATICQGLRDTRGDLHVLTLAPEVERNVLANARGGEHRGMLFGEVGQLDGFMKNLAKQAESMMARNLVPVLLCPSPVRRPMRALLHRSMPFVSVLGLNEVPATMPVRSFAAIQAAA
ncbi:MAG TPA: FHIPEP family type III secretion protein, partial [Xanthomonadaceae bacterium]